jgi:hypothetical protein
MIPRQADEPRPGFDAFQMDCRQHPGRGGQLSARHWPTVRDVDAIAAAGIADAIDQIRRGQVCYYGLTAWRD